MDILLIGETKPDVFFLDAQFFIEGYNKPLRQDASGRSEGLLVFTSTNKTADKTKNSSGISFADKEN